MNKRTTKISRDQSIEDIAGENDVDPETVRRWVRRGCPADRPGKGKPTRLNNAEVAAWKREVGIVDVESSPDLAAAKLRKENALADKYELQVAKDKGALVPVEEVKQWIGQHVTAAKNKLIGLGASVTPLLEGRDAAERQTIIDQRVTEILEELAAA